MKPRVKYFDMGFLPGYCGFTASPKDFVHEMKRLRVVDVPAFVTPGAAACTHTFTKSSSNDFTQIVTISEAAARGKSMEQVAAMLAHEATHVWQENKEWMREKEPGHEIEAYAIQYITQQLLRAYRKKGRK